MNKHEMIFENVELLTYFYPPSKELKSVLRKDMFSKKNKAAYQEVVHYLLNILSPELTKQRVTWPVYDSKAEIRFRKESHQLISELNEKHHWDIPQLPASHLISPGGGRFVEYVLKLAHLVVAEHISRKGVEHLILCPKPTDENDFTEGVLRKPTLCVLAETAKMTEQFRDTKEKAKTEAAEIERQLCKRNVEIKELKHILDLNKQEFAKKQGELLSAYQLEEKCNALKVLWGDLEASKTLFSEIRSILEYLNSDIPVLRHGNSNTEEGNVKGVNLVEMISTLNSLLCHKAFDFPNPNSDDLNAIMENIKELNEKYSLFESIMDKNNEEVGRLEKEMQQAKENMKILFEEID
nr:unnamed protein product [Callosobruchus chinensis]